jgi:hypothetical protein
LTVPDPTPEYTLALISWRRFGMASLSERNATRRKRAEQLAARSQQIQNEIADDARRARVRRAMGLLSKEAVAASAVEVLDEEEFRGYGVEWRSLTASASDEKTRNRWRKLGREEKEREALELAKVRKEVRVDFPEEPTAAVRKVLRDLGLKKITPTWYIGNAEYEEVRSVASSHGGRVEVLSEGAAPPLQEAAE